MTIKSSGHRRFAILSLHALLSVSAVSMTVVAAKGADPFTNPDPFKLPATQPAAAGRAADPNAPLDVHIAADPAEHITFGPAGCPVVVCENHVWNILQGTIQAELDGEIARNAVTVLSDDGKYFAAALKSQNQEDTGVAVWSTETGRKLFDIPGTPKRFVDLMLFSRNKYLILGGRTTGDFLIWDVREGKALKPIDVKADRVERGKTAFSPDGEHFLAVVKGKLILYRTSTASPVIIMAPPRTMTRDGSADEPVAVNPVPVRQRPAVVGPRSGNTNDALFVYAWMQALRFSTDGKEIAAISTQPAARLIVWDIKGKLLIDEPLHLPMMAPSEYALEWLPDKSGWLINGSIFDRELKRSVLRFRGQRGEATRVSVLDANHLIGAFPSNPAQLQSYTIPWKEIRQSIALMHDPNAALLGTSEPISVNAGFGQLGGDATQTARLIVDALTERLKRDGISVMPVKDTAFRLRFSEAAGDTLPIYQRQSVFDICGKDTGRTIVERKGSLVIELVNKNEKDVLWRETLDASSARSFREDINDVSVRKSMLDSLTGQIRSLNLPYFIPKDEHRLALPVIIE